MGVIGVLTVTASILSPAIEHFSVIAEAGRFFKRPLRAPGQPSVVNVANRHDIRQIAPHSSESLHLAGDPNTAIRKRSFGDWLS